MSLKIQLVNSIDIYNTDDILPYTEEINNQHAVEK